MAKRIFRLFYFAILSVAAYDQQLELTQSNCNAYYNIAGLRTVANTKVGTIDITEYFEIEFNMKFENLANGGFTNVFHLGIRDHDRYPGLWIHPDDNKYTIHTSWCSDPNAFSSCTWSTGTCATCNPNIDQAGGTPDTVPELHRTVHFYLAITPSAIIWRVNDWEKSWTDRTLDITPALGTTQDLYFSDPWYGTADVTLTNICIRTSNAGLSNSVLDVDCIKGTTYGAWSECSAGCHHDGEAFNLGTRSRERMGDTPPENNGEACPNVIESEGCQSIVCCVDIKTQTFDWDKLVEEEIGKPIISVTKFDVISQDLSLKITVELPYLAKTTADDQRTANFGVTYVLDFEDFNAHKNKINEPGTCQNRKKDSFVGISNFNEFWRYSLNPQNDGEIGSSSYLSYGPPGDHWTISMKDNNCKTVIYEGIFTWQNLRDCNDGSSGAASYTSIDNSDPKWLNLTGTFYINAVSPFWYGPTDLGYYRVYQLLSQPFVIAVSSTIHVLGSAGINLMTMTIIAVYKEGDESDSISDFELVFMTETAEYMHLELNSFIGFEKDTNNDNIDILNRNFEVDTTPESGAKKCLSNKNYLCTQLWKLEASNIKCEEGINGKGTDFSGDYTLGFDMICIDVATDSDKNKDCTDFLSKHTDLSNPIELTTDLIWKDSICKPEIFEIALLAQMLFYSEDDNEFKTNTYLDGNAVSQSHLYQVGIDRVFVEIGTSFPDDTYNIFNTELVNVWLCTFPNGYNVPDKYVDGETMGCFNSDHDDEYDTDFHLIFSKSPNVVIAKPHGFEEHIETISNYERFSFIVPDKVARDTLYVHVQIEVELQELTGTNNGAPPRRRRILLNVNSANRMEHFGDQIGINYKPQKPKEPQPNQPNKPYQKQPNEPKQAPSTFILSLSSPWIITIACLLGVILIINIIFMCYNKYNKRGLVIFDTKKKKNKYQSVKNADSEDFYESEANPINVVSE